LLWRRWRGAQSGRSALMPGKETAARLEGEPSEGKPRRCYSSRAICIKLGSLHHGMAGEPPLLAPLVLRRTQRRQCANRAIAFSARDYGFRVVSTIERGTQGRGSSPVPIGCPRPSWHSSDRQAVRCIADDGAQRCAKHLQYIPGVADQVVLTRAMIKDMFWATCISISVVCAVNALLWVWGTL
jgi:hypothetical protein